MIPPVIITVCVQHTVAGSLLRRYLFHRRYLTFVPRRMESEMQRSLSAQGPFREFGHRLHPKPVVEMLPDAYADAPRWFFLLFLIGLALKDVLNPHILNNIVPYSSPGGFVLFKIHPGSYILASLGIIASSEVIYN